MKISSKNTTTSQIHDIIKPGKAVQILGYP
jgi:hypothetical protein